MPITTEQREARRQGIGSSDSPAILGVDPWRSIGDVYVSKVYELDEIEGREPIELGNDFEGPLVRWAAEQLGVEIQENVSRVSAEDELFAANLDAEAVSDPLGVEAKFSGDGESWGEQGSDEIPDRVIVQTQHQCYVADLDSVAVPVLTVKYGRPHRLLFRVDRNDDLIENILEEGRRFWEEHVLPKKPPPDRFPSLETLKRVRRVPSEVVDVPAEIVLAWEDARQRRLDAKKAEDQALEELLTWLGDAEVGDFGEGGRWFTYKEQGRPVVPTKELRTKHPEVYDEIVRETRYRVPRIQKR